jgi:hypothetical protein
MKVLIAASAVQVTLGLTTWDLSYFNQILIYPDEYINPNTNKPHKGETNLGGFMCFSWPDFVNGYKNPIDKINLGLHEFGHALRFNGIKGNDTDYFFENYFPRWTACASKEFYRMQNNVSIFRKYGSVNINEFFSVAIETFFEAPQEFKSNFPELFKQTAILLNQCINDNGTISINCREQLMNIPINKIITNQPIDLDYTIRNNALIVMPIGFFLVGLFSLKNEGYLFPSPYICFFITLICWMLIEKQYSRFFVEDTNFKIKKGFIILKGYKTIQLPLSYLISVVGSKKVYTGLDEKEKNQPASFTITYYYNEAFYEDEIYCDMSDFQLTLLENALKKNYVHVFIKDSD